jgi:hypothetical protein
MAGPPVSSPTTLAGYALIAAAMLVCEWVARRDRRLPSFSQAVSWANRRRPARLLLLAVWLWLGWHVFVRSD